MIKTLYVFSNCGHLNELPKSGGQTSARRVMKGFADVGISIRSIRRHRCEFQSKFGHIIEVVFFAIIDWMKVLFILLFGNRNNSAFMNLSYAGTLVPYELLLTYTAKVLGYKTIYYLKGGKFMDAYSQCSSFYKSLYKKNIDNQSLSLFEGYDALKITRSISTASLEYFPNYMFDNLIPQTVPLKSTDCINLCYFGRVNAQKNILLIVDIFNIVSISLDIGVSLTIIGGSDSKEYRETLIDAINRSKFCKNIHLIDRIPYSKISKILEEQHFFVFPTSAKAEGHSNSLNEAMSHGVIPIVSNLHFNGTIVGNEGLVVDSYEAKDYAEKIVDIYNNNKIATLSYDVWSRLKETYAYSLVNKNISDAIKKL